VPDKAREDFERALALYPYEMLAHYGLGMMAYKAASGERDPDKRAAAWETAYNHFLNAYRADPKRPETLYYLALVYHHRCDQAAALHVMAQAQTALEAANDRRKGDAARWVRELQRLHARAAALLGGGDASS
jgi:tetratricopeptide (TPR) repeat protein